MMNRQAVAELDRLYQNRDDIQRHREIAADTNFWLGVLTSDAFPPGGQRRRVISALGGNDVAAAIFKRVVAEQFEGLQRELDAAIVKLGGEP